MKDYLLALLSHQSLTTTQAYDAIVKIGRGEVNQSQLAAFLMGIQQKGVSVDELIGFREGMLSLAKSISLDFDDTFDLVGTGGDGKDTFNISTTAAFVVAGAGLTVVKHGNHGVSSAVGSSTVLEYLGLPLSTDENVLNAQLEKAGICLLHAPLFHSAMRFAAPTRKELGFKTFFNLLGPLLNPAGVKNLLAGVYHEAIIPLYEGVLKAEGYRYGIIFSEDVYDEISLTSAFQLCTEKEGIRLLEPADLGFEKLHPDTLYGGGSVQESANILLDVLQNKATQSQRNVVLANAGVALSVGRGISIADGLAAAAESLDSGRAYGCLKNLVG